MRRPKTCLDFCNSSPARRKLIRTTKPRWRLENGANRNETNLLHDGLAHQHGGLANFVSGKAPASISDAFAAIRSVAGYTTSLNAPSQTSHVSKDCKHVHPRPARSYTCVDALPSRSPGHLFLPLTCEGDILLDQKLAEWLYGRRLVAPRNIFGTGASEIQHLEDDELKFSHSSI